MKMTDLRKRIITVLTALALLIAGILFIKRAYMHPMNEYGTLETDLVRINGSSVCQSCIGLSDADFFNKLKELFSGDEKEGGE